MKIHRHIHLLNNMPAQEGLTNQALFFMGALSQNLAHLINEQSQPNLSF